jgi:hypothetical protein
MTLDEEMAMAVLKGEKHTALILAQKLMEEHVAGRIELPPVTTMEIPAGRKKLIVMFDVESLDGSVDIDFASVREACHRWLHGDSDILGLIGARSVHLFVEPEPPVMEVKMTAEEIRKQLAEVLRT